MNGRGFCSFWVLTFSLLLIGSQETSAPEQNLRDLPEACLAAKCALENEAGIGEDEQFLGIVESFNKSGKCYDRNMSSIYQLRSWITVTLKEFETIAEMGGDKGLALVRIGSLYYYYCDNQGCSLSRRLNAMSHEIRYWSRFIDQELIWYVKNDKWDWTNSWLFYRQAFNWNGRLIAPVFVMSHLISVRVLKRMLKDDQTAIQFHMAELITDMIGCLWNTLFNLCAHVFFAHCTKINSSDPMHYDFGLFEGLYFLDYPQPYDVLLSIMPAAQLGNQLFNLLLVLSRCYALKRPVRYIKFNAKKHATKVVVGGYGLLLVLAIWPSMPRDTRYQVKLATIGEWEWAWRIWPMFRDSNVVKFLMEVKSNVFTLLFGFCFFGQVGLSAYLAFGFRQWIRKGKMQNETQQQAKKRKFKEKQKVYLMMCTVGVNLLSMIPSIVVQFSEPLGLGLANKKLTGYLIGAQFIAGGFNSAGGLLTNLAFTESYREAFTHVWINPAKSSIRSASKKTPSHRRNNRIDV